MDDCEGCFFYDALNGKEGFCLRYPPIPILGRVGVEFHRPKMRHIDTCGEFKPDQDKSSVPDLGVA